MFPAPRSPDTLGVPTTDSVGRADSPYAA
jgi:hypothetical protein